MTGGEHRHTAHRAPVVAAARRVGAELARGASTFYSGVGAVLRRTWVRRLLLGTVIAFGVFVLAVLGLWWRLSAGPIELDIATPWLKAAIEENFGGNHTVAVGGTQIERDEKGNTSLRMRDIVVRDAEGAIVASAPKAEVGFSIASILAGQLRPQSLNLVGAEMSVRIETDGSVTVFAGADKRPIATARRPIAPPAAKAGTDTPASLTNGLQDLAGVLVWIDSVGASGLEVHDLRELGLKSGNLTVDDRRSGKKWIFDQINASLTRPDRGGITFRLESANESRPWVLSAAMRPLADGIRAVGIEARKVSIRDILLALRLNDDDFEADLPLSASIRAEIDGDGMPQAVQGQIVVDAGTVVDNSGIERIQIDIDRADFRFNWDAKRRTLLVPFQIHAGGNQFTLRANFEGPEQEGGAWIMTVTRGDPVIDPIILAAAADQEGFALNRANMRARIDLAAKRIDLEQGDFRRIDTRPSHNVGVAVTGRLDWSGPEPHLAFGVAATRMPMPMMTRLWPVFAAAEVRNWVMSHMSGGMVERVVVAGNSPLLHFGANGPPMADEGLSVDIETSGSSVRPISSLPPIRDADLTVHVTGRTATVNLGRGTVEIEPGRKLSVTGGVFEVPDTHVKPSPARATLRIDGTLPSVAALLATDALRDNVALAIDPATSRGAVAAQVNVNFPLEKVLPDQAVKYAVSADVTNFAADKMVLGQKIEAAALKVSATSDGYQISGDVKINGTPATIDLQKKKGDADGELRVSATLDEAARRRLGFDLGGSVTGAIPVKVAGRFGKANKDERMSVEADLAPVKIDNLLPGWLKAAGRPARATFAMIRSPKSVRFEDLAIDGSGVTVRGSIEIDSNSDLVAVNFPVFALSEGDKVTLKADRGNDGALRVVMRGDVYDGRGFVKSSLAGAGEKGKQKLADLDLDIKIGTVAGHNGETLRGIDLKLARRSGRIRSFTLSSKIGRDTPLIGDLRFRARDNHQVIYIETDDAGALFRFTDTYPRMFGGQMWAAMDPPTQEQTPQIGTLYIRNFVVRGETTLDRVVSGAPGAPRGGSVEFSEMRADFTRLPGRMAIRDGVVRGPLVGATIEGQIDYVRDEVYLRGTFVPFYGLNNMFGQIPIVGLLLGGGSNEGLLGITYEAVGPPSAPRITVNPVTAIAPGLLRKFIPSPGSFDRNFIPPTR